MLPRLVNVMVILILSYSLNMSADSQLNVSRLEINFDKFRLYTRLKYQHITVSGMLGRKLTSTE